MMKLPLEASLHFRILALSVVAVFYGIYLVKPGSYTHLTLPPICSV